VSAGFLDRWIRRLKGNEELAPAPVPPDAPAPPPRVVVDLDATLSASYRTEYPLAQAAVSRVLKAIEGVDLEQLAKQSPSLKGYDWANYLRCSQCRVVRFQRAIAQHLPPGARVLDFGSYFGNFGLALTASGFQVEAIDSYDAYGSALANVVALQRSAGIVVHDFARVGYDLAQFAPHSFDSVLCAGVIEHMAHTPRLLLESLTRVLRPGGIMVLDTPNLAYLYKRLALVQGRSVFPSIRDQYFTQIPFEGHHREYVVEELEWMLETAGHEVLSIETFNYSMFGLSELVGDEAVYFREMELDPTLRELIISVSRVN
jgi:2-polyprenyl-3-methyl-5-hydroxy-6-metoxy-1,4-benzoquinol methylase